MRLPKFRSIAVVAILLALGFLTGRACRSDSPGAPGATGPVAAAEPTIWTCSMHPQVRLPEPGQCPICFMDLIPADAGGGDEDLGPRTLQMTEAAMRLAEIETAPTRLLSVAHEVSMVGKVALDETRVAYITAWVGGRLDRLFVDYTGVTVRKGDHLVEIYSPQLYSAQQELLQAIETARRLESSSLEVLRSTTDRTVISTREKLRLYGLTEAQVQEVVERGTPDEHVTILAPIGGVVVHKNALKGMYVKEGSLIYTIADLHKLWVLLDAYESDIAWLRYGQDVSFHVEAYPGETFHGRIAFIDPLLDDRTRTVKVRLNVDNSDLRLKPDMFVSATASAVLTPHGQVVDEELSGKWMCPMHPEVLADGPEDCPECGMDLVPVTELGFVSQPDQGPSLVVPATAPLITGKRAVVYVRVPDQEKPTFEGRVITLGPRAGDWYIVHDGLEEGEQVVVNGNFKIDSELQIRAKPSMMSPDGGAHPPGHQDGEPAETIERVEAPAEFRAQLGALADAYLVLQAALAADEDGAASAAGIGTALDQVDMGSLEGDAHGAWMELLPDLRAAAESLTGAGDVEARRAALAPMTGALVRALDAFGYEREGGELGVFHCPMALDDGADWIQTGDQTSNPYYGSAMLRCGSRTRALDPGHAHGGAEDPPPAPAGDEGAAAPAEFRARLGALADAYVELQESLSADEDGADAVAGISAALGAVDMSLLEGAAHDAWMEILPDLRAAAGALADAGDVEARRAALAPLTGALARALDAFGYEREGGELGLFHCPMALDDGADWIQVGDRTSNPYYGSAMLRCGARTRILRQEP